ncbi:hypothetical protein EC957_011927 [Mortierella hygrophila]|uniref:F-box domain-containing protein n=1 Tax=Mortierella hygrophila TaxID=979708 RepID=A0A9P6F7Z8_9FUNG|nr:hypothetical protein EC957_011927 [Mortierella hygrophila]
MSGNTLDNSLHKPFATEQLPTVNSINSPSVNSLNSPLVSLPPNIIKLVSFYLIDPLDLLRFSYTCHDLFSLITPADWYSLATYTYTNWVQSCGGPNARDWKMMVLKDAALGVRLGATLPRPDVTSSMSSPISSALTTISSPTTTTDVITSNPPPHLSPLSVESEWLQWTTNASTCLPSSLDEFNRRRPLRVKLSEAQFFKTDLETQGSPGAPWVRMGSLIYNIDRDSHTAIAASMITRPKSVPSQSNGGDPRPHDHEILFYNLPDLTNPIARCGSDVWEKDIKTGTQAKPWHHPLPRDEMQVALVVEIKHYPEDTVGGMRVVVVIAFGQRTRPWVNNATDSHILGVWLMLKVIEVRVPVTPMTRLSNRMMNHFRASSSLEPKVVRKCVRINPDSVIKYESLDPGLRVITTYGRIVKLYSALEPRPLPTATTEDGQPSTPMDADTRKKVDCIAVFSLQNSEMASAMILKKVLFCDDDASDLGRKTYSKKAVSREVSCMTLFPDHSGYEHCLVLFNQHGRGMVWDWVREKQITQLHMPIDRSRSNGDQRVNDEPANIGVVTGSALATAGNSAGGAIVDGAPSLRRRVYYWGVQVIAALEVSFPEDFNSDGNNNGTFRIVTMADGQNDEWESCWWNITMDELQEPMESLPAPPIIDTNRSGSRSNVTNEAKPTLFSSVKRFEHKTYGVCIPEQQKTHEAENNKPIQFISYIIWNHYKIGLSSRMGICMVDMEEPESGLVADRQWITFLKDREDMIDIATFGHNLIVILKTGHLVWSFYGQDRTPFVSKEGLGLRMDKERSESDSMNNRPAFVQ